MRAKFAKRLKGIKMLNDFDKDLAKIDLSADNASELILLAANNRAKGLSNKNDELLDKASKHKIALTSESSAQEKLDALESTMERERLESKGNYTDALASRQNEFDVALEKVNNSNSEQAKFIHKLVVENGLQAELTNLNVNKDLIPLIMSGLSAQATVIDGQAVIGEVSLSDYMKEWAETPTGKASILAAANSGGDGSGGVAIPTGKKMADLTGQERNALFQSNPVEFNRLKQEALAKH